MKAKGKQLMVCDPETKLLELPKPNSQRTEYATIFRFGKEIKIYKGEPGYDDAMMEQAGELAKGLSRDEQEEMERKKREEEASHQHIKAIMEKGKVVLDSLIEKTKRILRKNLPLILRKPESALLTQEETSIPLVAIEPEFVAKLNLDKLREVRVIPATSTKYERLRFLYSEGRDQEWPISKVIGLDFRPLRHIAERMD